ncbi:hypothetical protein QIG23_00510 [Klebsiella pneumoniae]|uniref:ECs_2282 family putative zinc-binding protein n=2 Tax=Klebsiella pneumoniae TaxID=573 RepID=UPI0015F2A66B|nr:hypothetical protein [Klebsiella pneumoniae]MDH8101929.1 hypothetical protein [Klebsiella pneumoniae]HBR6710455.1 hypothetical protein [Klebsiella pneumoniae]
MSKLTTMKVACPDCGSGMLKRPDGFDFDTNFVGVSCANCGREITKDDVVKQGTDVVKKQVDDILRDAFKGTGWKLK